jgi:hypothetical protein
MKLLVARGEVVEHRVAEHVAGSLAFRDVLSAAADHQPDLELVVDDARIGGPVHFGVVADDAEGVALVVDRPLVPDLGDLHLGGVEALGAEAEQVAVGARLAHVQLEAEEVAQPRRPRDGGEQLHVLQGMRRLARPDLV